MSKRVTLNASSRRQRQLEVHLESYARNFPFAIDKDMDPSTQSKHAPNVTTDKKDQTSNVEMTTRTDGANVEIKPTLKRYIILLLFSLNSANKAFQWIQVPASTIKATQLYGVDNYVINFASIIFHLAFMLLSWPACLVIERIGIRRALVTASLGTVLGSLIKCCSCTESGLYLLLLGQVCVALSEQLIFSLPTRLASIWFPDHQVSLSIALCLMGSQLGVAIGFMVPKWFLDGAETHWEIGQGFYGMFQVTLVYSSVLFVFNWWLFDEAPEHAPGKARSRQIEMESRERAARTLDQSSSLGRLKDLFGQILKLCKNRDLVIVALTYGFSFGRGDAISTVLDQTMQPLYPSNDSIIGITGCLIIVGGALGAPVWGRALDKYRAYKTVSIVLSTCTTGALILFAYVLIYVKRSGLVYLVAILFGFFQTAFMVALMEYAIELTYPAPELVTSSLLNLVPSIIGPIFILIASYIVDNFGALKTNIFYLATVIIAFVMILCTRERLKRQAAVQLERSKDLKSISTISDVVTSSKMLKSPI